MRHAAARLQRKLGHTQTGLPSEGFTEATDIFGAQARVFVYDWLGRKAPSPEDFKF